MEKQTDNPICRLAKEYFMGIIFGIIANVIAVAVFLFYLWIRREMKNS